MIIGLDHQLIALHRAAPKSLLYDATSQRIIALID